MYVCVIEPISVKRGNTHVRVSPIYKMQGKSRFKICPQIELDDNQARKLKDIAGMAHVIPAIRDDAEVVFSGDSGSWKPVGHDPFAAQEAKTDVKDTTIQELKQQVADLRDALIEATAGKKEGDEDKKEEEEEEEKTAAKAKATAAPKNRAAKSPAQK